MGEAVERAVRLWILTKSDDDLSFVIQGFSKGYPIIPTFLIQISRNPEWLGIVGGLSKDTRTISDFRGSRITRQW